MTARDVCDDQRLTHSSPEWKVFTRLMSTEAREGERKRSSRMENPTLCNCHKTRERTHKYHFACDMRLKETPENTHRLPPPPGRIFSWRFGPALADPLDFLWRWQTEAPFLRPRFSYAVSPVVSLRFLSPGT